MPTQFFVYTGETCVPAQTAASGSPTFTSLGVVVTANDTSLVLRDIFTEGDWIFSSTNSELRRVERILDSEYQMLINEAFTADVEPGVSDFDITDAGTGYSDDTGVATTGGTGTGLTVDITQTLGVIDTVVVNDPGEGYAIDDVITITTGNADATFTVTEVVGDVISYVKASRARSIDLANTGGAAAAIDGVAFADGLTLNLAKDPLYGGAQRDYIDPLVLDATGTSVTVQITY